ncbi:unnamed protein product [Rodentolepis nana]|uniref:3-ketodihydrosphingosine reductase n=1 Tax=Rodentolepis nana TaxID=102285 RepID=A0A3P7ST28_RODNA|nr:unnamed protein product [Rodentolepis nana]
MIKYDPLIFVCFTVILLSVIYLIWRLGNPPKEEPSLEGKHVLITGASSGIGKALAVEILARSPSRMTLVARNAKLLAETRDSLIQLHSNVNTDIEILSLDITLPYDEIVKSLEANNVGVVDILINCAGTSVARTFEDTPPRVLEDMIRINYMGAVNLTKALLPDMLRPALAVDKNGEGDKVIYPHERRIAFFSSPAAQLPIYGFSAYSASKAALSAFANTIQQELEDDGIMVTVVYPPDTDTPGFCVSQNFPFLPIWLRTFLIRSADIRYDQQVFLLSVKGTC